MIFYNNKENKEKLDGFRSRMENEDGDITEPFPGTSCQRQDSSGGIFGDMKLLYENRSYKYLYIRLSWQFLLFLTTLNVFAAIYQAFEQQQETIDYTPLKSRTDVIGNFTSQHNVTESIVRKLFSDIDQVERSSHERKSMSYMEAIILTLSVFYTIGWGHITPQTTGGKVFCVISSLLGVPITFIMISTGSTIFIRHMKDIIHFIYRRCCTPTYNRIHDDDVRLNYVTMLPPCLLAVLITFSLTTSLMIMKFENFSFLDSLMFCFLSLTTTGFGNVFESSMHFETHIGKSFGWGCFLFFWLLFGIIIVSSNLVVFMSWMKVRSFGDVSLRFRRRIKKHCDNDVLLDDEIGETLNKS